MTNNNRLHEPIHPSNKIYVKSETTYSKSLKKKQQQQTNKKNKPFKNSSIHFQQSLPPNVYHS